MPDTFSTVTDVLTEVKARRDAILAVYQRDATNQIAFGQIIALASLAHSLDPNAQPNDLGAWFDQHLDNLEEV